MIADDLIGDGQPEPGAFASRWRGEKGLEDLGNNDQVTERLFNLHRIERGCRRNSTRIQDPNLAYRGPARPTAKDASLVGEQRYLNNFCSFHYSQVQPQ